MTDLFGNPESELLEGPVDRYKGRRNAFPYPPGTGPDGETCKTCRHATRIEYHAKAYWKCGLMKHYWTHGPGTDIRLKDEACKFWKRRSE